MCVLVYVRVLCAVLCMLTMRQRGGECAENVLRHAGAFSRRVQRAHVYEIKKIQKKNEKKGRKTYFRSILITYEAHKKKH